MATHIEVSREASTGNRRFMLRLVVFAVVAAVAAAFVFDNTDEVKVGYVLGTKAIPLILVLVGAMVVGAVLDRLGTRIARRTRSRL